VDPTIIASGGGAIVCTASTAVTMGQRELSAYGASRAGVMGLVRAAAAELVPMVSGQCRVPAVTYTGLFYWKFVTVEECDDVLGRFRTLNREGHPEDVANLIAFLLSEWAGWITAASYPGPWRRDQYAELGVSNDAIDEIFVDPGRGPAR
jgi:NAD(P)-dependent dehydrogenase (short-subunit alcohol dehydrogenase family)